MLSTLLVNMKAPTSPRILRPRLGTVAAFESSAGPLLPPSRRVSEPQQQHRRPFSSKNILRDTHRLLLHSRPVILLPVLLCNPWLNNTRSIWNVTTTTTISAAPTATTTSTSTRQCHPSFQQQHQQYQRRRPPYEPCSHHRSGRSSSARWRMFSDDASTSATPPSTVGDDAIRGREGGGGGDTGKNNDTATPTPGGNREYSYPELTADAALHKAGLNDPDVPTWQNPLHHYNSDEWQKFEPSDFASQAEFEAAVVPAAPLATPGDDGASAPTPAHLQALANEMVNLSMLEMNELVNKIADHYGFHEGLLSPDGSGGAVGGGAGALLDDDDDSAKPVVEEKTAFDVRLVAYDDKAKIKVIKEVRSLAGLGLKEAKELVEGAPKVVLRQVKKEEAEAIKVKLEELGATIEVV